MSRCCQSEYVNCLFDYAIFLSDDLKRQWFSCRTSTTLIHEPSQEMRQANTVMRHQSCIAED